MNLTALLTFLAAVAFAVSPLLSSGFNGFTPDQFPVPQNDPPVQPEGYAFSIWGIIYLWLIIGAGFGLLRRPRAPGWETARPMLFLSLVAGAFWIPLAQVSVFWATVLIFVMLLAALAALYRAGVEDRWLLREPIGLYAGWLTAASSVSVGLMLAGFGVTGPTTAAIISLGLALLIAISVLSLRRDSFAYAFGVIWALTGVIASNLDPFNILVAGQAGLGVLCVLILALRNESQRQ
ncbi:hypothetical protein [Marimonas lutisalis]|uniref:hypothetical protein n=1 Tax=Marimonas lutisalis TaxID=2545756 RepID=UPI0010F96167|nr:hypothetical protein [Marimonas lutisalis]